MLVMTTAKIIYKEFSEMRSRHKRSRYLDESLWNHYNKKSQTVSKLYRRYGFDGMVKKYGLIDPAKYIYQHQLVKAWEEVCR